MENIHNLSFNIFFLEILFILMKKKGKYLSLFQNIEEPHVLIFI